MTSVKNISINIPRGHISTLSTGIPNTRDRRDALFAPLSWNIQHSDCLFACEYFNQKSGTPRHATLRIFLFIYRRISSKQSFLIVASAGILCLIWFLLWVITLNSAPAPSNSFELFYLAQFYLLNKLTSTTDVNLTNNSYLI